MIDVWQPILKALKTRLASQVLPVYSFVPDNPPEPFIYIGEIETTRIANKGRFELEGTVNIEAHWVTKDPKHSIKDYLSDLSMIRYLLQPDPGFVLDTTPDGIVIYTWELQDDTGPQSFGLDRKYYNAILQYGFRTTQIMATDPDIDFIIHALDHVIFGADKVIHIK